MRMTASALITTFVLAGHAYAQTPAQPYDLDRYKPSEAALLRNYGDTLVAQTPLLELRHLDPYKPSHAALLQQIGGGLPLWGGVWYPFASAPTFVAAPPTTPELFPADDDRRRAESEPTMPAPCDCEAPAEAGPSAMATLLRPESNDGVWISYDGRRWVSGGRAVPLADSLFERTGDYNGFPVYRRAGVTEDVIYVTTREGRLAPYRLRTELR